MTLQSFKFPLPPSDQYKSMLGVIQVTVIELYQNSSVLVFPINQHIYQQGDCHS